MTEFAFLFIDVSPLSGAGRFLVQRLDDLKTSHNEEVSLTDIHQEKPHSK